MDPEFSREFTKGIAQILNETMKEVVGSLQGRIAALETRIARLEAAREHDTAAARSPSLKVVGDG
jgi:uncharacterized small protein (DUF1192 family)